MELPKNWIVYGVIALFAINQMGFLYLPDRAQADLNALEGRMNERISKVEQQMADRYVTKEDLRELLNEIKSKLDQLAERSFRGNVQR